MSDSQNKNFRLYYIIFGVLMALIVILGAIVIYFVLKPQDNAGNGTVSNEKEYMNLTKEEALATFKEMQKPDYVPSGYIDEAVISPNECELMNGLLFSYEEEDDVKEVFGSDPLTDAVVFQKAEFVKDYYAVVFSAPFDYGAGQDEDGTASRCRRMFSFNKKYYDYSEENFPSGVFVDTSTDFIKVALPVLATSSGQIARLNTIYDYDFEEKEDSITLNIYVIGLGYDVDYSNLEAYKQQMDSGTLSQALQFSTLKYRYDASTKQANWVHDCDGCAFGIEIDRTIPLSDSEVSSLLNS